MRCARVVGSVLGLSALLAPGVAHAQIFSVYTPPKPSATPARTDAPRFRRLHIGSYLAIWDQPPVTSIRTVVNVRTLDPSGPTVPLASEEVDVSPDASPLLTADYYLSKNISIGGWWNPLSGEADIDRGRFLRRVRRTFPGATIPGSTEFDFHDNFYDAHVTFYLPDRLGPLPSLLTKGVSIQAGYSVQNIDLDAPQGRFENIAFPGPGGVPRADHAFTLTSPNAWITKRINLGTPLRGREDRPITMFASGGYYFDSDFDNAWNAMLGMTFKINERWSISGSYWRVFPRNNEAQSRVSLGVTAGY